MDEQAFFEKAKKFSDQARANGVRQDIIDRFIEARYAQFLQYGDKVEAGSITKGLESLDAEGPGVAGLDTGMDTGESTFGAYIPSANGKEETVLDQLAAIDSKQGKKKIIVKEDGRTKTQEVTDIPASSLQNVPSIDFGVDNPFTPLNEQYGSPTNGINVIPKQRR